MIVITYEYPTAEGNTARQVYKCVTDEQAEHVCKRWKKEENTDIN